MKEIFKNIAKFFALLSGGVIGIGLIIVLASVPAALVIWALTSWFICPFFEVAPLGFWYSYLLALCLGFIKGLLG